MSKMVRFDGRSDGALEAGRQMRALLTARAERDDAAVAAVLGEILEGLRLIDPQDQDAWGVAVGNLLLAGTELTHAALAAYEENTGRPIVECVRVLSLILEREQAAFGPMLDDET